MPLYRARPRSLYYRRRRAINRRRRYGRRRLHIGRIRSRFTVFNVKQTQNITFTFFQTGSPAQGKWQAMSLEAITPSGNSPKPGLNLRFAMFGDRGPGTGGAYHYPFDYYMLRLVKVELRPAFNPFETVRTQGSTYIDKEGNITTTDTAQPWGVDPYAAMSSRKTWSPHRYHKRVFVPKPTIQQGGQSPNQWSTWYTPGRRQQWINSIQDNVVFYGMGMSLRQAEPTAKPITIEATITFYIRFGQWTGLQP
ncbi:capsid protein [Goose circovirus]|uniref:Capsid protein n=1 Tax=Goose circovirus TaxID=146032 RepID=A0A288Q4Z1_GOCV|nr:capsid protein [Goose circovirus]AOS89461.1 capsid protein [Goose circovirus]AOS89465.1 capsid protein [Goose circovirus]AOS89470.1 capsid protein [Goose circovirus]